MQNFLTHYGVAAVFVLMLAESACIPIPSELIMCLGGALAAGAVAGSHPDIVAVIVAGVLGNVVGSYLAYAVGRYGGLALVHRWGRYILLREHDITRATAWFDRHGNAAVLAGRLVPVVRTFISLPAGIAAMPPVRFGVYTLIGCIPWTTGLALAGYAVGDQWQTIADDFHGATYIIAAVLAVLIVAAVVLYVRSRRRSEPAPEPRHRAGEHIG